MKSAGEYIIKAINSEQPKKAIELISRMDASELTTILDEKVVGITFSARQGNASVMQYILFDHNCEKITLAIFKKLQKTRSFLGQVSYTFLLIKNELEYRSTTHFNCKLDELDGLNYMMEYNTYTTLLKNVQTILNLIDEKKVTPFVKSAQAIFDSNYNRDFRNDFKKNSPQLFDKYQDLFFLALEKLAEEIESNSIKLEQVFHSSGKMHSNYSKHLANYIKKENLLGLGNMSFKTEFLIRAIDKDLFCKYYDITVPVEEMLASIKHAMDSVYSLQSFSERVTTTSNKNMSLAM
jgi:hypothetical protein